ncbi:hypothetical protein HK405_008818 [Cladochytrium tenue]|nr:hypothetical protein HK405_008818 [Cladochytrium tenue]
MPADQHDLTPNERRDLDRRRAELGLDPPQFAPPEVSASTIASAARPGLDVGAGEWSSDEEDAHLLSAAEAQIGADGVFVRWRERNLGGDGDDAPRTRGRRSSERAAAEAAHASRLRSMRRLARTYNLRPRSDWLAGDAGADNSDDDYDGDGALARVEPAPSKWKVSFVAALVDSRRTCISAEELERMEWRMSATWSDRDGVVCFHRRPLPQMHTELWHEMMAWRYVGGPALYGRGGAYDALQRRRRMMARRGWARVLVDDDGIADDTGAPPVRRGGRLVRNPAAADEDDEPGDRRRTAGSALAVEGMGTRIRVAEYPSLVVGRDRENWGWTLQNRWVFIWAVGKPGAALPPASGCRLLGSDNDDDSDGGGGGGGGDGGGRGQ